MQISRLVRLYFYSPSLASNFCVWKSFQRGSLKIHLLLIAKASVRDGTIDTQRKIGQDRKRKEQVETEMQTHVGMKQPNPASKEKKKERKC